MGKLKNNIIKLAKSAGVIDADLPNKDKILDFFESIDIIYKLLEKTEQPLRTNDKINNYDSFSIIISTNNDGTPIDGVYICKYDSGYYVKIIWDQYSLLTFDIYTYNHESTATTAYNRICELNSDEYLKICKIIDKLYYRIEFNVNNEIFVKNNKKENYE